MSRARSTRGCSEVWWLATGIYAAPAAASFGGGGWFDPAPFALGLGVLLGVGFAGVHLLVGRSSALALQRAMWRFGLGVLAVAMLLGAVGLVASARGAWLPATLLAAAAAILLLPIAWLRLCPWAWLRGAVLLAAASGLAAWRSSGVESAWLWLATPWLLIWGFATLMGGAGPGGNRGSSLLVRWSVGVQATSAPACATTDTAAGKGSIASAWRRIKSEAERSVASEHFTAGKWLRRGSVQFLLAFVAMYAGGAWLVSVPVEPLSGLLLALAETLVGGLSAPSSDPGAAQAYWLSFGLLPSLAFAALIQVTLTTQRQHSK